MKKLNKKGFTLVEMLVVIAIIAVLVAIVVPTVSNSTTKAKAATDAANLRSIAAEVQTYYFSHNMDMTGTSANADTASYTAVTCKLDSTLTLSVTVGDGKVEAKFGTYTTTDFAGVADGSKTYSSSAHTIS